MIALSIAIISARVLSGKGFLVSYGADIELSLHRPLSGHSLSNLKWPLLAGIGGLTLGMMTRTARGHTARPLQADRYETASFVLVQAAAIVRVLGGMLMPDFMLRASSVGRLWAAAFLLYAIRYWSVLTQPRLDGKPG